MARMPFDLGEVWKDASINSVHAETALGNQSTTTKPKKAEEIDMADFEATVADVVKVDETHGLVLGFAIVCKKDGVDYFDLQDDHIPEDSMLAAAVDFMANSRVAKEMHRGDSVGSVLFAFPLTTDIAKAFGIETKTTGLMIAMKPTPDVLGKFKDGSLTGFSIGGKRLKDENVT